MTSLYECWRLGLWRDRNRALPGRIASGGVIALACLSAPAMSAHADEVTYGYDALGRLTSVTVAGATAYYDYDVAGNITGIRR